jgi:hypothetical protein
MLRIPPQDYSVVTILVAFGAAAGCVAQSVFLSFTEFQCLLIQSPQ